MRDLVTAFATANIPFEKLKKKADGTSTVLRQFLEKYVRLDGERPAIPDPCNLRRTHLPKVREQGLCLSWISLFVIRSIGIRKLQDTVRSDQYYVAIVCDESSDPRPDNNFCVTLDLTLIPKVTQADQKCDIESCHVKFDFPEQVNHETMSSLIDQGLRELYIQPRDVIFFRHDSASYMAPTGERMQKELGYVNMAQGPCWAHLLNIVGTSIFEQKLLPTLAEYLRLTRFARIFCRLDPPVIVAQVGIFPLSLLAHKVGGTPESCPEGAE